jgi:hypothetical protein
VNKKTQKTQERLYSKESKNIGDHKRGDNTAENDRETDVTEKSIK